MTALTSTLVLCGAQTALLAVGRAAWMRHTSMASRRLRAIDSRGPLGSPHLRRLFQGAAEKGRLVTSWIRAQRDADAVREQLPQFAEALSRSLAAGTSMIAALSDAAESVADPLRRDAESVVRRCQSGASLASAFEWWAQRSGNAEIGLLAVACSAGATEGRGAARTLAGVAASLSQQADTAAEAKALAAQARASAVMLVCLPVVALGLMSLVSTDQVTVLFTTAYGQVCLITAVGLDVVGALWMRRMVRAATC